MARRLADAQAGIAVLIEIDADGHRSGVKPDSPELLEIAQYRVPRDRVQVRTS